MANHTATQTVPPALAVPATAPSVSLWTDALRRFRRHRLAVLGAAILTVMVIGVVAGPLVYRVPIDEIDFRAKLQGPSAAHPFGTDDLGQDLLARMMYGGRISLAVGVAAMLIAIVIGTTIGALSGYVGGMADHALMRVTDLFLALPQLPLLLLVVYLFSNSLKSLLGPEAGVFVMIVGVIGGLRWMPVARLVVNAVVPRLFAPEERAVYTRLASELGAGSPLTSLAVAARTRAARERIQEESLARIAKELPLPQSQLPHLFVPDFRRAAVESLAAALR